ncbi:MAG: hypothetical protein AB198_02085 [Parcubacteria bacterium C7867-003]|nr:MAG: hypothetical protein AB198_02085 [Parcubacteria bacterium C7867-003]
MLTKENELEFQSEDEALEYLAELLVSIFINKYKLCLQEKAILV